ncbi:BnaC06g18250D [Brassica napus]|uniref:BnaC06g18250D protein n=1 Tax=Brassica napus TaxID=3708 RepID=A0A078GKH2_BRANA|nr:BnaC06g18250D [Brassica napus]
MDATKWTEGFQEMINVKLNQWIK